MEKIELVLIIIEFILIAIEMGLSIFEIYLELKSSKEMQNLKNMMKGKKNEYRRSN